MSVTCISWAYAQRTGSSSRKAVLVKMAENADEETLVCYPSVSHIVESTECNRKTVISAMSELERQGLIADTGARCGATGQIKIWQLRVDPDFQPFRARRKASQNRNSSKTGTVPVLPAKSPVFTRKESQKRDTEPSGTVREPPTPASCAGARDSTDDSGRTLVDPESPPQHFRMSMDWRPGNAFAATAFRGGVDTAMLTDELLFEFCLYWAGQDRLETQGAWEHKLFQRLRHQQRQAAQGRGNDRQDVASSVSDIDDTSWANGLE